MGSPRKAVAKSWRTEPYTKSVEARFPQTHQYCTCAIGAAVFSPPISTPEHHKRMPTTKGPELSTFSEPCLCLKNTIGWSKSAPHSSGPNLHTRNSAILLSRSMNADLPSRPAQASPNGSCVVTPVKALCARPALNRRQKPACGGSYARLTAISTTRKQNSKTDNATSN